MWKRRFPMKCSRNFRREGTMRTASGPRASRTVAAVYDRRRFPNCGTAGGHRPPLQLSSSPRFFNQLVDFVGVLVKVECVQSRGAVAIRSLRDELQQEFERGFLPRHTQGAQQDGTKFSRSCPIPCVDQDFNGGWQPRVSQRERGLITYLRIF